MELCGEVYELLRARALFTRSQSFRIEYEAYQAHALLANAWHSLPDRIQVVEAELPIVTETLEDRRLA